MSQILLWVIFILNIFDYHNFQKVLLNFKLCMKIWWHRRWNAFLAQRHTWAEEGKTEFQSSGFVVGLLNHSSVIPLKYWWQWYDKARKDTAQMTLSQGLLEVMAFVSYLCFSLDFAASVPQSCHQWMSRFSMTQSVVLQISDWTVILLYLTTLFPFYLCWQIK